MSDPDRLTSHDDKTFGLDTRALILRIIVVAFLAALFWQASHRRRKSVTVDGAFERGNQLLLRLVSSHAADLGFEGGRSLAIVRATRRSHSAEH